MRVDQIEQFTKEFRSIVYQKFKISDSDKRLKKLYAWDKNDSHKNAILKELDFRDKLEVVLTEKLKGETYEKWKEYSALINKAHKRYIAAKQAKEKWELEINKINISDFANEKAL